ncbi:DUF2946 family protein [Algiphilus sp. W345]|uniref:DUF2946 family protein n=1 Tax=Banduia mediterranea TaxID=3075609 RepID=A0ABU2WEP1_9GAMM|nr:DUF2946 family protein [Algiphilus sp. W345]MDT0496079.1 DUF2946 family protein [Algiphilus sp. W345]
MEEWVARALRRWPNVPALYGWLSLDRRGRWLIKGEHITRPQIIDTINPNYAADARGCWYFQNGPQRGYVSLEYAPLHLRINGAGQLMAHTGVPVDSVDAVYLDENGALLLESNLGPGLLDDQDLVWALSHLLVDGHEVDEAQLANALDRSSGSDTSLKFNFMGREAPVRRCDFAHIPARLGFVREPQPEQT